ncbi:MAG TPA: DnaB-like helicase C-terminal domain-containing protein [Gemmatimonadales bacterium]|nr:DnaB-like helicase C-terminal domain-containing protein [Gemmatimonadales bacterium]
MPDIPRRSHPVADVVSRVDERLSGTSSSPESVSTGFPSVDRILGGGLRRRDLIVLGGDVGVGKSAFALAAALRVAERGEAAVILTGEVDEERMWERALAIEGRVRLDDLRRGKLSDEARAAVGAAAVRLRDRPLVWRPLAANSFEEIAERIQRAPAPLTIIDYLQLLPPRATGADVAAETAEAVRRLKTLAQSGDTALLVVAQLPRHNPKRRDPRPELDDFGAQGAVKWHADVVLALFREEMYQSYRGVEGATELIVAKNRHGQTGFVDLYFYREWMRFEDMVDPDR